ncbi:MAG TPA: hypothetical protein VGI39_12055 [Polyangiaceae bacterium]|jgi:glutathione synthase/RimK-type ligase-like ATP-grasp enzyme
MRMNALVHPGPLNRAPRLAFATCDALRGLYDEEQAFLPMLRARGVRAEAAVWDDPAVSWASFDAVVMRSTWDYFRKHDAFLAWLGRVEKATRLWNPPSLVRWNLDKRYLRELAARGVTVVPTVFCDPGKPANLERILAEEGWDRAVLKPAVSGGGYRTHRVSRVEAAAHQGELDDVLLTGAALVQPFLPEIQAEGEWSLLYFGGRFSHAVLKVPTGGDYRIQLEFGGTFTRVEPSPAMFAQVEKVLAALPEAPAYARIDGVRRGDTFLLMEAELIEPYLYTPAAPESAEAYVHCIESLLRQSSSSVTR